MKIRIERGTKQGKDYVNVKVNNFSSLRSLSRKLTGSTDEAFEGIFSQYNNVWFRYGDKIKHFTFEEKLSLLTDAGNEVKRKLQDRINQVQVWIKSIDIEETIEFDLSEFNSDKDNTFGLENVVETKLH